MSWTANLWLPGAPAPAFSTDRSARGAGSFSGSSCACGSCRGLSLSRRQPWRAPTKPFQLRDREFDRSERPRGQDRRGDHDAARGLAVDDQIGADTEHRRLQQHAQHLGNGAEAAGDIRGALLMSQIARVGLAPARADALGHAHGVHDFRVAARAFGNAVALQRCTDGFLGCAAGQCVGEDRHGDQQKGTAQRDEADPGMKCEADRRDRAASTADRTSAEGPPPERKARI